MKMQMSENVEKNKPDPSLGLQPLYERYDFDAMKLSQYSEGDSFTVRAFRPLSTKFGERFVMLTDNDNLVMANTKIAKHIMANEVEGALRRMWQVHFREGGEPMFTVTIGALREFNGFPYNEVEITSL